MRPAVADAPRAWPRTQDVRWNLRRLRYLASIRPSNVDKKSVDGELEVQLCNYTDVYHNQAVSSDIDFMPATATRSQVQRFELRRGDVLLTKDSETAGDIAVTALVRDDLPGVLCGYHLALLRPLSGIEGRFLAYALRAAPVRAQTEVAASGVTRFALSVGALSGLAVPTPSHLEQRTIADFLDRETEKIDALVAKKQRLIELLQEKRVALISHAVTKGLNPRAAMKASGVEWLGDIPAHWSLTAFRRCCQITEGQVDPKQSPYRDAILIAPNHIESGTGRILAFESAADQGAISGKYLVRPGDVVYSKIRPALNKVCVATGHWLCSADMYPIRPLRGLSPQFLFYYLLSRPFVQFAINDSMRVAMPKVNRESLSAYPCLFRP